MKLDRKEVELFRRLKEDFVFYAPRALRIRTKAGKVAPFVVNAAQLEVHRRIEAQRAETGRVRALILKGRQQGVSTYVQGRFFWRVTHERGFRAFILTHMDGATNNLFSMAERFYENVPPELKPSLGVSNAKELDFAKLDSGYKVGTAGSKGVGRSDTIQLFHGCLGLDVPVICGATGHLRPVRDFEVGDLVRTRTGAVARISFISAQVKPAKRLLLKGMRDFPLVATDDHRFWTVDGWLRVRDLAPGDLLGFPVPAITAEVREVPFAAEVLARRQGGGRAVLAGPAVVEPTYELGRVVGLYLAEGCILRQHAGLRLPSGVCFAVHEREVARTQAWLNGLPSGMFTSVSVAPRAGSKTVTLTAYGRAFAEWMERFAGAKDGKRFPDSWQRMGEPFARGLVHGYLAGDGHSSAERDRRISLTSIRSATVVGLRDALAALGYGWASINHKIAAVRHGRDEREAWTLRLTGHGVDHLCAEIGWVCPPRQRPDAGNYGTVRIERGFAWVPIADIEDAGEQEVRDFEVDHPDHSYCVLQAASHNSEVAYWPNAEEHVMGVLQAVAEEPGTEVLLESTSAGPAGVFYDRCMAAHRGETDFILIFIPWYLSPEYRRVAPLDFTFTGEELAYAERHGCDVEQMAWRRAKVRELGGLHNFRREYPATVEEAFRVEAPGALWKRDMLDACRVGDHPDLVRVVVAIDPSGGKGKSNAEVGMVVAGLGVDGMAYVLEDVSEKLSPDSWGKRAVARYKVWRADRIVAERNFGGDMVEATIRTVDPDVSYKDVVASRGKQQRAEPVQALYEQGRVKHVGMMAALEDEMTSWQPGVSQLSPNRVDALVWAVTDLLLPDTESSYDQSMSWVTGVRPTGLSIPAAAGG